MGVVGYVVGQVGSHLPTLLVLLAGLILVGTARGRLPGRSGTLALAGMGVLLLGALLSIGWALLFTQLIRQDWTARNLGLVTTGAGVLLSIWHATGLGLLVAAVLAGRRAGQSPVGPPPVGQPYQGVRDPG
ncbi:hypothetical protein [Micromonospora echinofusca]|uniref:Uncharacterized protein n=1 Tax=Micromonospora echinofusca TaxID=47858 RepID=A0ABS3VXN6_MICEH|nr:hypothetical protein [Micromonospora echinofusca]MBO4209305.1 hypothetical protein [Micromonospora echinofusca]